MTETFLDDPMTPLLIGELRKLLTSGRFIEGVNLHVTQQGDRVQLHIMAVSTGSLGVLLAILTDQAELDDLSSLSCRITPADRRDVPDAWQYDLTASRYPVDRAVVFSAKIRLPVSDLPEVIGRLRRHG